MKKMWRSSLARFRRYSVLALSFQRFSVCVRVRVRIAFRSFLGQWTSALSMHMDTWTIHNIISTIAIAIAITMMMMMARLDNCAALERKVFFVSVSVRFGLVCFGFCLAWLGFGYSDTHACASVEYLTDLDCTTWICKIATTSSWSSEIQIHIEWYTLVPSSWI